MPLPLFENIEYKTKTKNAAKTNKKMLSMSTSIGLNPSRQEKHNAWHNGCKQKAKPPVCSPIAAPCYSGVPPLFLILPFCAEARQWHQW
jgi:hypothetical protein